MLVVAVIGSLACQAQKKDIEKVASPAFDASKEAFIIDELYTRVIAENDGTAVREQKTVVHILADAGVKQFAILNFSYTSANETVAFDYVRVRKPDGTIVNTPDYNIQDMPADVMRVAPMYSDIHEKHVTVKGLGVGDTLEYLVRSQIVKPEIPGQFWLDYSFSNDDIVRDERLELNLPRAKRITLSNPNLKPEMKDEGDRKIYRWSSSNLVRREKDSRTSAKLSADKTSVAVTTFSSWEEVGQLYRSLQQEQVKATPAIQSKAVELTKGLTTDDEKIRAIYSYVALHIHYVSLSFGIGRYQPHPAEEVLGNEYGDCKDKHTLLASLLKSAGYEAWPALLNSSRKIDKEAPSISHFDHVITVVPRGDKLLWLDTTPEVAPFGLILPNLRDKDVLVVPVSKPAFLTKTPADPPLVSSQTFTVEGNLTSDGTFSAHIEQTYRGDSEVVLRSAFRQVPQAQWKDLMQNFSYRNGYAGDVSSVTASAVDDTNQPFRVSYEYLRKKYGDWENRRITPPLPPIGIEVANDADEKVPDEPLVLGAPGEVVYRSKVTLPAGCSIKPPKNVDLVLPFAEYHTTQSFDNGVFTSIRRFVIKNKEVPLSDWEEYRKFRKEVADDEWQFIPIDGLSASSNTGSSDRTDAGDNEEIRSIFTKGTGAIQRRDVRGAQEAFERVLQKNPNYPGANFNLALALATEGKTDEALSHFRREQEISPSDSRAFAAVASLLVFAHRNDEAINEYRKLLRVDPRNIDAALQLGQLLSDQEKFVEAAATLEQAVKASPESPSLHFALASAYLKAGQKQEGVAELREAVEGKYASKEMDPSTLNQAAYALAESNTELDLAKRYAEKAVAELEVRSATHHDDDGIALPLAAKISAAWDTLGWVYFQLGDLPHAESYVRASWLLSQRQTVGYHLGQIYERQGRKTEAAHTYQLAMSTQPQMPQMLSRAGVKAYQNEQNQIRARYENIAGKSRPIEIKRLPNGEWTLTPQEELGRMRKIRVTSPNAPSVVADVSIVFSPAKVIAVRYDDDDAVKQIIGRLENAKYNVAFPTGSAATLVRRATVVCTKGSGCDVVLHPAESDNASGFSPSNP